MRELLFEHELQAVQKKINLFWSIAPSPNFLFSLWLLRSLYHDITKMLLLHQEFDLYAQVREKRYDSDQICGKLNVGAP